MKKFIEKFLKDEAGQDLVEYALLLSLLAIAGVATVGTLGNSVNTVFSNANTKIS
jgi:pilus assembly protein Flp/PilA